MNIKKKKNKAFTLTELLVVVVVIGVLSAVVLPKFNKVIETRRTTEAEELMSSIRTEQERRCALDKKYLTDISKMNDIVKSADTKNYTLTLARAGINAARKDNYEYTLEMPSYADGRICCRGKDCERLNKNYPNCDDLKDKSKTPDYQDSPESCKGDAVWVGGTVPPQSIPCVGDAFRACGCQSKGMQKRTCNTATGTWNAWGSCSVSDECECTGKAPDSRQPCNGCGQKTRSVTCNTSTGKWESGNWSACSKTEAECKPEPDPEPDTECTDGAVRGEATCNVCGTRAAEKCVGGKWTAFEGECSKTVEACLAECTDGQTREVKQTFECQYQIKTQECRKGQWEDKNIGDLELLAGAECVTGATSATGGNTCSGTYCLQSGFSGGSTQTGLNENGGGSSSSKTCDSGRVCKDCKWKARPCGGSGGSSEDSGGAGPCKYTHLQIGKAGTSATMNEADAVIRVICVFAVEAGCSVRIGREEKMITVGQEICYESPVI